MVAKTPNYLLPYREGTDPADIPAATADLANAVEAALNSYLPKGQVARAVQSATVTTSNIEVVALSATFTAIAGRRYKVTYDGAYQGTVTADILAIKFRWASGASVTTGGTSFRNKAVSINTASGNTPLTVVGSVSGIPAGQVTIGVTIARNSGTGNVSLNTDPGLNDGVLLIEDVLQ